MRSALGRGLAVIVVAGVACVFLGQHGAGRVGPPVAAASSETVGGPVKLMEHGHVYVLRGLANIWSRGMDKLGEQLGAKGVRWSIHNHRHWKELASEAAEKYKRDRDFAPIILIGHSLGADAAVLMAARLGEAGVPVRLMICFDGVAAKQSDVVTPVSGNVAEALNFYKGAGWGMELVPSKSFKGKLENVDLRGVRGIGHLNIDKNPELQARVVNLVLETLAGASPRSASN